MPKALRAVLMKHPTHPESTYVFYNKDGSRLRDIRGSYNKAIKASGLDHMTFHSLRHTYASLLVMKGRDLPTVQQLLGHADIKTTMRYAHLAPDHLRLAVEDFSFDAGVGIRRSNILLVRDDAAPGRTLSYSTGQILPSYGCHPKSILPIQS